MLNVRRAEYRDAWSIATIIVPVIREGATYTLDENMSETQAVAYWMAPDKETFVAEQEGVILGTYYMRPNQAGGGGHVCNCGYMTSAAAAGKGIARHMCEHSLEHARSQGYRAMQLNFVVSTKRARGEALAIFGVRDRWSAASRFQAPSSGLRRRFCDVPAPLTNSNAVLRRLEPL